MKTISIILLIALLGFAVYYIYKPVKTSPEKIELRNLSVIGNSITRHPPRPEIGWNNDWGMAASSPEKDFAHLIRANKIDNFVGFESSPLTYDMSNFEKMKNDIVVIKLGENVGDFAAFDFQYQKLVDYFQPSQVICVTTFWPSKANETIKIAKNCTIVEATISKPELMLPKDSNPYWSHPNDEGMSEIAKLIESVL